jgi:hypothetical protein
MREVIVFRLRPVGDYKRDLLPLAEEPLQEKHASINEIEPENRAAEQFMSSAIAERVAERCEAALITIPGVPPSVSFVAIAPPED